MGSQKCKGFTLVELLVVILIISILISLLLPAINNAVKQAQKVHCQSNLHQFGLAILMYANDRGLWLPPIEYMMDDDPDLPNDGALYLFGKVTDVTTSPPTLDPTEGLLFQYYSRSQSIEICPSMKGRVIKRFQILGHPEAKATWGYAYNYKYLGYDWGIWGGKWTQLSDAANASATVVMADGARIVYGGWSGGGSPDAPAVEENFYLETPGDAWSGVDSWFPCPSVHFLHNGSANVLFLDGHVETRGFRPDVSADALLRVKTGLVNARIEAPVGFWAKDDKEFDLE